MCEACTLRGIADDGCDDDGAEECKEHGWAFDQGELGAEDDLIGVMLQGGDAKRQR